MHTFFPPSNHLKIGMVGWDIVYIDKTSCQWFHVQYSFTAVEVKIKDKHCREISVCCFKNSMQPLVFG